VKSQGFRRLIGWINIFLHALKLYQPQIFKGDGEVLTYLKFPINHHRVLRTISDLTTPSPPEKTETTTPYLATSSPPDVERLRSANKAFNEALWDTALTTLVRGHGQKLSGIAEHLHVDNYVLR